MSDLVATRYGVLGRALSVAALQTIVLTSRNAVNALSNACLRFALVDTLPPGHSGPSLGRWQELLGNLFPAEILVVDSGGAPSPDLLELRATEAEEHAIRRLLAAAAAFLLSESAIVGEAVALIDGAAAEPAERDRLAEAVTSQAQLASAASDVLLGHAEAGSWRALLSTFVGDHTPSTPEVSAADVLPRDREFPPVVVSLDDEPIAPASTPAPQRRARRTFCVVYVGDLPDEARLRLRLALQGIALDPAATHRDATVPAGAALRALSERDTALVYHDLLCDELSRERSHADTPPPFALSELWFTGGDRRRRTVGPTARIADLLMRVGPDLAPRVGAAFRALATSSADGEQALANVVRLDWAGSAPSFARNLSMFRQDEQEGMRQLASLCRLLSDDLQTAAIAALAHRRAHYAAPEPIPVDIRSGLTNALAPHHHGVLPLGPTNGIPDAGSAIDVSAYCRTRTLRCRPRITREHWPVRYGGDRIHIGGVVSGISSTVRDPDGSVWALLGALNGTRTVDEIVAKLVARFPAKSDGEVRAEIGELVRAGYVEDAESEPDELPARTPPERHPRAHALFRWMDTAPRSSNWDTQLLLRQARVVVIGVGGIGCSAAQALAQSGVGELHLVEPDVVTMSNLSRQVLFVEQDLGRPKIDVAVERLRGYNSDVAVTGEALAVTGPVKLAELAHQFDLMVLTVDQPQGIRSWANEACVKAGTPWVHSGYRGPLVSMGLYQPGTGPCYTCTTAATREHLDWSAGPTSPHGHASEAGNAVSAGLAGSMAANAVKSLITGVPQMPTNREYEFNLITLIPSVHGGDATGPDCPTCGQNAHAM